MAKSKEVLQARVETANRILKKLRSDKVLAIKKYNNLINVDLGYLENDVFTTVYTLRAGTPNEIEYFLQGFISIGGSI